MKIKGYKMIKGYIALLPSIVVYNGGIWLEWLKWAISIGN